MFYLFHRFSKARASTTLHPLQACTPDRGECRPCPTAPQQLSIRKGLCDPLPLSWSYAIGGCVPLLLQSKESWEEVVG